MQNLKRQQEINLLSLSLSLSLRQTNRMNGSNVSVTSIFANRIDFLAVVYTGARLSILTQRAAMEPTPEAR